MYTVKTFVCNSFIKLCDPFFFFLKGKLALDQQDGKIGKGDEDKLEQLQVMVSVQI